MVRLIEDNKDAISRLCERHRVRSLDVFGSAVDERFDPARSDVDFLVDFLPRESGHAEAYFGLLEDLERLLGRPVDLVMRGAIRNPYFRDSVVATCVPLFKHAA